MALVVDGDAEAGVRGAAAQVGGPDQRGRARLRGIELRDEGVGAVAGVVHGNRQLQRHRLRLHLDDLLPHVVFGHDDVVGSDGRFLDRLAIQERPISAAEIDDLELVAGHHHDPHSLLGTHPGPDGVTIRALRPLRRAYQWVRLLSITRTPPDAQLLADFDVGGSLAFNWPAAGGCVSSRFEAQADWSVTRVELLLRRLSPTGSFTARVWRDSEGSPGALIAQSAPIPVAYVATVFAFVALDLLTPADLASGEQFHLGGSCDTAGSLAIGTGAAQNNLLQAADCNAWSTLANGWQWAALVYGASN